MEKLPFDIKLNILSFDNRFTYWKGKLISKFSEKDKRYRILEKIPRTIYYRYDYNYIILNRNKKYEIVLINDYPYNCIKIIKRWFSILRNAPKNKNDEFTIFYKKE